MDAFVIIIAAIVNMVIGFLWYSKWLFGPIWGKLSHHSYSQSKHMGRAIGISLLNSLLIAYFLAFFETYLGVTNVTDGMFVGFLIWLGFVITTQISPVLWRKEPIRLFAIDTGYKLFSLVVLGGLIGA